MINVEDYRVPFEEQLRVVMGDPEEVFIRYSSDDCGRIGDYLNKGYQGYWEWYLRGVFRNEQ